MLEGVCWEMSGDVSLGLYEAHSGAEGSVYPWLSQGWSHGEG